MPRFDFTRREFLVGLGSAYWTLNLSGCASLSESELATEVKSSGDFGPVDRTLGDVAPLEFFGDAPSRPHDVFLRSLASRWTSSVKPEPERVPVVIIGAGVGGLTAAYELRDLKPVVLEQAARVGGNAKAQSWKGIDYSIGAAYLSDPELGSPLHRLLIEDLKIDDIAPLKHGADPVWLRGKLVAAPAFEKLKKLSEDYLKGKKPYPNIPERDGTARLAMNRLDRASLKDYLAKEIGDLPQDVALYLEKFCHAAFAARPEEISAAAGINFLAAEDAGIRVANGGNAAILERLYQRLVTQNGSDTVRCETLVTSIEVKDKEVLVTYLTSDGVEKKIIAKSAIVAIPKFIARHLIKGLENDRLKAMYRMRYRSYLVANMMFKKDITQKFYDMYLMSDASASDLVSADYAKPVQDASVLTFYRPIPHDGARVGLLEEGAFAKYRAEFEGLFLSGLGKELGLKKEDLADLRLARWGHPVVLAQKGFLKERIPERVSAPFQERVFFAQQDNWCLPCFETAALEAIHYSTFVRRVVG